MNYIGNYDYYLEKKEALTAAYAAPAQEDASVSESSASSGKLDWKAQKEAQAKERKRQNDLKRTEARIEELENRSEAIDELMTHEDVYSNSVRCQELAKEKMKSHPNLRRSMSNGKRLQNRTTDFFRKKRRTERPPLLSLFFMPVFLQLP